MRQYVICTEPRKFDAAEKCFTISKKPLLQKNIDERLNRFAIILYISTPGISNYLIAKRIFLEQSNSIGYQYVNMIFVFGISKNDNFLDCH